MDELQKGSCETSTEAVAATLDPTGSREASAGSPNGSNQAGPGCNMPQTSHANGTAAEPAAIDQPAGVVGEQQPVQPPEPEPQATAERVCSNCFATSTPMWRNDSNGRKTLCNACGVRLSRQASKAKQEAAGASGEAPTSLIAGKQPRSRSSPAKRSASACRAGNRQEPPGPSTPSPNQAAGPPQGPMGILKRRRSDQLLSSAASLTAADFEPQQGDADPEEFPIELLVHRPQGTTRIPNVSVGLQLHNNDVAGETLLSVYHESGQIIAQCAQPQIMTPPVYKASHQAWLWSSQAFSLLLKTERAFQRFKGLLKCWTGSSSSPEPEVQAHHQAMPSPSTAGKLARASSRRADAEDLEFLRTLNQKILDTQSGAAGDRSDPKSVTHPLSVEVLMLMLDALQFAQSQSPGQTLPPQYVDVLCRTCAWAPNRVIGLVVHKYWVNRLSRAAALSRPHSALLASSPSATLADTLLGMSFLGPNKPASVVRQLSIDLSSSQTHQAEGVRSGSAALGMQFSAQAPPVAQQPELVLPSFVGTAGAAAAVIDDCDPLDPAYLARISDPHETRRSPGEDHSDQTTDMTDGHQSFSHGASDFDIMMPDAPVRPAEPAVLPEGRLGSLLRPRRAALRRAVSFMDRPTGRNKSPGTPTSNTGAASLGSGGRHQSLPSLIITSHRSSPLPGAFDVEQDPMGADYDDNLYFASIINQH